MARALVRSQLLQTSSTWAFAVVYILYPSTSATIFQTFYCRKLTNSGTQGSAGSTYSALQHLIAPTAPYGTLQQNSTVQHLVSPYINLQPHRGGQGLPLGGLA